MNSTAQRRTISHSPRRWHNHLPVWIAEFDHFARLPANGQLILQGIANACPPCGPDGSLVGAFGGRELITNIGCSPSTFWLWVNRLARLGFLVALSRGGQLAIAGGLDARNLGNVYGIPGSPGALDHRRCDRELCRMVRSAAGDVHRQVLRPGTDATLWHPDDLPEPEPPPGGYSENRSGGTPKIGVGYSENRTPSSMVNHGVKKTMVERGVYTQKRPGKKARLRHVEMEDLTNTRRLLSLYDDSVTRGLVDASEAGRLRFVAMAERVIRVSRDPKACRRGPVNPLALFASNVNEGRWLLVTQQDEDRAQARIKAHLYGHESRTEADCDASNRLAVEMDRIR